MNALAHKEPTPEVALKTELPWWVYDCFADRTEERTFWITKGLGSGGTYGLAMWHILMCFENSASKFSWSIAPTYQQVADTLIPTFVEVLSNDFGLTIGEDFEVISSGRPRIILKLTAQEIHFKSAHKPERMVGPSVSHVSGTEIGLWPKIAFEKSRARMRCPKAKRRQYLGEGTPEGFNWWELEANFPEGVDEERNYVRVILHTIQNKFLKPGYHKLLKQTYAYDRNKLRSYLFGQFTNFTRGTAYWEFFESRNVTLDLRLNPALPVILSFDFNRSPLTWVLIQEQWVELKYGERYKRFCVLGCTDGEARGILDACAEFAAEYRDKLADTVIEIDGDPTGYHGSHKSEQSDFETIKGYLERYFKRVVIRAKRKAPAISERLDRTAQLMAYKRLVVAAWCRSVIRSFTMTALKPGTWEILKPPDDTWTHPGDAVGYPICRLTEGENFAKPRRKRTLGFNA